MVRRRRYIQAAALTACGGGLLYALPATLNGTAGFTVGDVLVQNRYKNPDEFSLQLYQKGGNNSKIFDESVALNPGEERLYDDVYGDPGVYTIVARTDAGFEDTYEDIRVWKEDGNVTGFQTRIRLSEDFGLNILPFSDDTPPSYGGDVCLEDC